MITQLKLPGLKELKFAQAERTGAEQATLVLSTPEGIFEITGHVSSFREVASVIMRDIFGVDTTKLSQEEWNKAWLSSGLFRRWLAGDPEAFKP
jgi:hypothetical protein